MKDRIIKALRFLSSPEQAFKDINKTLLDDMIQDYLWLLVACGIVSSVVTFIFIILRSLYYDMFLSAEINYLGALNYAFGISVSMFFMYLFSGTGFVFVLSMLLKLFLKIEYVQIVKFILLSLTPVLVFGWIPKAVFALFIWSLFLFILGISKSRHHKPHKPE